VIVLPLYGPAGRRPCHIPAAATTAERGPHRRACRHRRSPADGV